MENIVYQIFDTDSALAKDVHKLEFYCCRTNEVNPDRDVRELGICVTNKGDMQIDFSLNQEELKSLVKHLGQLLEYVEEFNSNSKPDKPVEY